MKRAIFWALAGAGVLLAQWGTFGGDARRDGWEKNEQAVSKDDVKDFRLLWRRKLFLQKRGVGELLPPIVFGSPERAFFAGSDNSVWSIAAEENEIAFGKPVNVAARTRKNENSCDGRLAAMPAQGAHDVYLLTGDGRLHQVDASDGAEVKESLSFVSTGTLAQALNVAGDVVYTSTHSGCGQDGAVWAINTAEATPKAKSFKLGADVAGTGGVALGGDGRIYVQTQYGALDPSVGKFGGALLALKPDLTIDRYLTLPVAEGKKPAPDMNATSPLVFKFKGDELVVSANSDGRLYVSKTSGLGGWDQHRYLSRSLVVPTMDGENAHGIWGGLSSWEAQDGSRFVLAPVWGPVSGDVRAVLPKAKATNGSIVAFKVDNSSGPATLTPVWISRELDSPGMALIANGVVFVLANGKFEDDRKPRKHAHATLYALDAMTGEELYSTGEQISEPGNLTGITVADGRVYLVTADNTVHVFAKER